MAIAFRRTLFHQLLALITILFQVVAGLPGGCHGNLEIVEVSSPVYSDTIWACSGIQDSSIFGGSSTLLAGSNEKTLKGCADYCATKTFSKGLTAGIWKNKGFGNLNCECWRIGEPNGKILEADSPGVTYIDFYDARKPGGRPSKAKEWGAFTCPAGSQSGAANGGTAFYCGPLTVKPAKPALADLGTSSGCAEHCSKHAGFQWVLSKKSQADCSCYGDLAGLKVTLNYSSTEYVIDYYDFKSHETTEKPTPKTDSDTTSKTTTKHTSATETP